MLGITRSKVICCCGGATDGWVGSARWVGVRLTNHNFWFLWCQHGWLSGVSMVGWGETQKSQFLVPVVSAWMVWVGSAWWVGVRLRNHNFWFLWCQHGWFEWGQHGGLGWDSEITISGFLWCQHGWLSGVSMVGWGETQKSQFFGSCGVSMDGWVGSAWWVGVRLRNHNFWFLWCQHGWFEWGQHGGLGWDSEITIFGSCGVSMDGWVGSAWWVGVRLRNHNFLVPVVSAWMVEWGQHGGLGCNSKIKNVFVAGGSARRRWQERYHEALPSLSTVLAWSRRRWLWLLIRESHRSFPCSTAFLLLPFACWAVSMWRGYGLYWDLHKNT